MPKKKVLIPVLDKKGKKISQVDLPDFLLSINVSPILIQQVLQAQLSNRIKPAHTKGRGEVRGGGRKPWRQKGLGRARHGSIRSPIWKGGGVVFGPLKTGKRRKKVNKKMRQRAIWQVLKDKITESSLFLVEKFDDTQKTKKAKEIIEKMPVKGKTLLVFANAEKDLSLGFRNLAHTKVILANNINLYDLLKYPYVIFTKKGWEFILQLWSSKKTKSKK
ncbi:50S ribosomal protein L4 [bacterium]|nr:50S ribosomal protein L4 [bacterium]